MNSSAKHRIFVYGSLKQGFCNHRLLETSTFVTSTRTLSRVYEMISLGFYPAVYPGGVHAIEGELYEVDEKTLEQLDRLESNGYYYERELINLAGFEKAWMYICKIYEPFLKNSRNRVKNTRNHTQVWRQGTRNDSFFIGSLSVEV